MKIVVDDKIPYIREVLARITDNVVYIKGTDICKDDVRDADALIVRTRTRCDARLLEGTSVKFVATATIGYDHIDTDYMQRAGIKWMNCPGCNSSSVAQYVRSVLLLLERDKGVALDETTIGIVGCGHVGSKVARVAEEYGMRVLVCDPPRMDKGDCHSFEPSELLSGKEHEGDDERCFVDMDVIERECDIITFHVPLTRTGVYKTYHIGDEAFFSRLKRCPVIVNTSRGEVIDNHALYDAIIYNKVKDAVIDTWEHEPDIDLALLDKAWIATPHIAGYSADGKVNADNMVIDGLCRHFGIENIYHIEAPELPEDFAYYSDADNGYLRFYNPLRDSESLKNSPEDFEYFRGNYPLRREKDV
ncbi:MAG: 4-phosphoerythronate dehydrogenase [Prevotellaceae bacterium]|nr:4-phosphoerythronate dehydrogenase [Prevotellaceae bacterium]